MRLLNEEDGHEHRRDNRDNDDMNLALTAEDAFDYGYGEGAKAQQQLTNKEWVEWVTENMWKQGSIEKWRTRLEEIDNEPQV